MKGGCRMGVQQLEEAWALRNGAREARLLVASHVPAALSQLGIVRPGDRLVVFADDFADAFASGFDGCDVVMVGSPSAEAFPAAFEGFETSFEVEGPHLWWFVNSIGGFGLRVPEIGARYGKRPRVNNPRASPQSKALRPARKPWARPCTGQTRRQRKPARRPQT